MVFKSGIFISVSTGGLTAGVGVTPFTGGVGKGLLPAGGVGVAFISILGGACVGVGVGTMVIFISILGGASVGLAEGTGVGVALGTDVGEADGVGIIVILISGMIVGMIILSSTGVGVGAAVTRGTIIGSWPGLVTRPGETAGDGVGVARFGRFTFGNVNAALFPVLATIFPSETAGGCVDVARPEQVSEG